MSDDIRELGRAVLAERLRQGLSQRDLAHRSDVSASTISHIEQGKRQGNIETLHALARGLGLEGIFVGAETDDVKFIRDGDRP